MAQGVAGLVVIADNMDRDMQSQRRCHFFEWEGAYCLKSEEKMTGHLWNGE